MERIKIKDLQTIEYLQKKFNYAGVTHVIRIDAPGIKKDELEDAGRFRDLLQDIEFELSKFGRISELIIIRSSTVCPTIPSTSIGKIFV